MESYEALVQQLNSSTVSEQQQALAALSLQPLTPRNWLSAVRSIPRLVQLLRSTSSAGPQARVIRHLLQHISHFYEGGGGAAAPSGIVPSLVSLLLLQDDAFVCGVAERTLSTLANNANNHLQIMEAGAIAPLVQLLKSSSENLHGLAADTLAFLAEDSSARTRIVAAGAIEPLLHLLRTSTVAVQMTAAMAIRIIAGDYADLVAGAGAIPLLVQLLKSPSVGVQDEATQTLGNLACTSVNTIAQIVAAGAMPLLVGLLRISVSSAETETLRREAAVTLGHLAVRAQSKAIAAGAIKPLVSLLTSGSEDTKLAALRALFNLSCESKAGQDGLAAAGAIAPIVQLLRAATPKELQAQAALTVANLASNNAELVIKAGAIPLIVKCMTAGSTETKQWAALALCYIASDFENQAALLAAAPLLPLVHLLTSSSEQAQEHAQQVLLYLSSTSSFPKQFVAAGAIPPLVHMLRSESTSVQLRAVVMLQLLTAKGRPDILAPVESAGALPLLAGLQTTSGSGEMRYNSTRLLQALTLGTSLFRDPEKGCPSTLPSTAANRWTLVHPASAAGPPSTAGAALPSATASPQQQQQQQLPPQPRKSCWSCGATGVPLKKCSACAVATYCGAGCQKADWKAHKGQCLGLKTGASGSGLSAAGEK